MHGFYTPVHQNANNKNLFPHFHLTKTQLNQYVIKLSILLRAGQLRPQRFERVDVSSVDANRNMRLIVGIQT